MVLLERLWDDVLAGPQPERGLGKLRKVSTNIKDNMVGEESKYQGSTSMLPGSPGTPAAIPVTPTTPGSARRDNVWRSVFNPGSNPASRNMGADVFDKPNPNSPTVYDWLYSGETRSNHR